MNPTLSWTQLQNHLTACSYLHSDAVEKCITEPAGKPSFWFCCGFCFVLFLFEPFLALSEMRLPYKSDRSLCNSFQPCPWALHPPPWVLQAQAAGEVCWETPSRQFLGKYSSKKASRGNQSYLQSFPAGICDYPSKEARAA